MTPAVLDASALLALFFDEPGAEKVENLLYQAAEADTPLLISALNWAEVLYCLERKSGAKGLIRAKDFERTMPLDIVPMDRELAEIAAHLKCTHHLGLADAFAAALAKARKAELVTGDLEFKPLKKEIAIVWLNPA